MTSATTATRETSPGETFPSQLSPRNGLGLIVRVVALLMWMFGLYIGISAVWDIFVAAVLGSFIELPLLRMGLGVVPTIAYFIGGWLILRNAERIVRIAYPHRAGFCDQCGYDLRASEGACPECGEVTPRVA
jgi:hypothetical protein